MDPTFDDVTVESALDQFDECNDDDLGLGDYLDEGHQGSSYILLLFEN
jgi:hypothetical protein